MWITGQNTYSFTFVKVGEILIKVRDYLTCLTIEGGVANMLTDDVMMWINGGLQSTQETNNGVLTRTKSQGRAVRLPPVS